MMRKLIEYTDIKAREEMGEYYILSKARIDNLLSCYEGGVKRIAELTAIINDQQKEIAELSKTMLIQE